MTHFQRFVRLAAAPSAVWIVTGLLACDGGVVIRDGINAGRKYAPGLVGGLTAEQCLQQGLCTKQ